MQAHTYARMRYLLAMYPERGEKWHNGTTACRDPRALFCQVLSLGQGLFEDDAAIFV